MYNVFVVLYAFVCFFVVVCLFCLVVASFVWLFDCFVLVFVFICLLVCLLARLKWCVRVSLSLSQSFSECVRVRRWAHWLR